MGGRVIGSLSALLQGELEALHDGADLLVEVDVVVDRRCPFRVDQLGLVQAEIRHDAHDHGIRAFVLRVEDLCRHGGAALLRLRRLHLSGESDLVVGKILVVFLLQLSELVVEASFDPEGDLLLPGKTFQPALDLVHLPVVRKREAGPTLTQRHLVGPGLAGRQATQQQEGGQEGHPNNLRQHLDLSPKMQAEGYRLMFLENCLWIASAPSAALLISFSRSSESRLSIRASTRTTMSPALTRPTFRSGLSIDAIARPSTSSGVFLNFSFSATTAIMMTVSPSAAISIGNCLSDLPVNCAT